MTELLRRWALNLQRSNSKTAAAADAARGAGRILPAGKDFIVMLFKTIKTHIEGIVVQ